jgi:hypothetical protein
MIWSSCPPKPKSMQVCHSRDLQPKSNGYAEANRSPDAATRNRGYNFVTGHNNPALNLLLDGIPFDFGLDHLTDQS